MQEVSKYTVFNIREYLNAENPELGENELFQVLSEFSCNVNPDVERFAKEQSIVFAKKQQSVTYLVFSTEDAELVGLAIKQIKQLQYLAGGMVVFLETNNEEKLLSFYQDNGFQQFGSRLTDATNREPHELIQLLKILK